jgi:hypothetical protein
VAQMSSRACSSVGASCSYAAGRSMGPCRSVARLPSMAGRPSAPRLVATRAAGPGPEEVPGGWESWGDAPEVPALGGASFSSPGGADADAEAARSLGASLRSLKQARSQMPLLASLGRRRFRPRALCSPTPRCPRRRPARLLSCPTALLPAASTPRSAPSSLAWQQRRPPAPQRGGRSTHTAPWSRSLSWGGWRRRLGLRCGGACGWG